MHFTREIRLFLMPPMLAAANGQEFKQAWPESDHSSNVTALPVVADSRAASITLCVW